MTTLPLTVAMIALSQNPASSQSSADFNNDGVVDTTDLIALTSNIGTACEGDCPTDLNNDGVTDQQDILVLMQLWGAVEGWVATANTTDGSAGEETTNPQRDPNRDMSWQGQGPVLLDAILYDQDTELFGHAVYGRWHNGQEYNQGEFTKAWDSENNVATQPVVYGAVDWDHNNQLTEEDKAHFVNWLDATVPTDYNGPICLDLEGQWWGALDTSSQAVMDMVINKYLEQLEYAKSLRPNAKFGFWGIPKKSHTKLDSNTASIQRLLDASTGLFPEVYEHNVGINDASRLQRHVERSIEMVNGQIPVYAQTFPRYKDSTTGNLNFYHSQEEFMRDQVQSSLNAVWTDGSGVEHRVSGISIWDSYSFVATFIDGWSQMSMDERKEVWNETDHLHIQYLTNMKAAVDVAYNAAQERLAQKENAETIAKAAAEEAARVAAAHEEASRLRADRKRQRSRLVRRLNSERTKIRRATSSYRKNAKQYKTARNSFINKRRSFIGSRNAYRAALKEWRTSGGKQARGSKARSAAWKKFATVRNQYRSSATSWKTNVKSWRVSAKGFKTQRSSYRTSRKAWKSTVKTWRTANVTWRQMARKASTLAAVGK